MTSRKRAIGAELRISVIGIEKWPRSHMNRFSPGTFQPSIKGSALENGVTISRRPSTLTILVGATAGSARGSSSAA